MRINKRTVITSTLLLTIFLLSIGTIAYFRRTVSGNITGQTGNVTLIVNGANAVDSESFSLVLQGSENENFVMPFDNGVINVNIDATGSSDDVAATIEISRTNLPENLKFYSDESCTEEITTYKTMIKKSNNMIKSVPIYWFWDGRINNEDDNNFINKAISANINVSATTKLTLYETLLSMDYTLDADVDFYSLSSDTNGQGLMMVDSTKNEIFPIVYYRGDVSNNNVIFADFCWLIVRTTETGGVKLLYNGEVNSDGSCNNYSGVGGNSTSNVGSPFLDIIIPDEELPSNVKFFDSPVYGGYMYNDINNFFTHSDGLDASSYYDKNGTLDVIGYKKHLYDTTIDSETGHHTQNKFDSYEKTVNDIWYEANISGKSFESLLEDTIWCNDRSISVTAPVEGYNFPDGDYDKNFNFYFGDEGYNGNFAEISKLVCNRKVDRFTVDSANGNGDLDYSIGLLTLEEIRMAGLGYDESINYLSTDTWVTYTAMTPGWFSSGSITKFGVFNNYIGLLGGADAVRSAVSLKNEVYILDGNGSFENPYVIAG